MPVLRYWDVSSGQYLPAAVGPVGPQGPAGPQGLGYLGFLRLTGQFSTSSQTYVVINSAFNLPIVVPTSGRFRVRWGGQWNNSVAGLRIQSIISTSSTNNTGFISTTVQTGNVDGSDFAILEVNCIGQTPGANLTLYPQWSVYSVPGTATLGAASQEIFLEAWPLP